MAVELSVVVPAYNEAARLGPTLAAICRHLNDGWRSWELIVVDDGSRDDTAAIAEREMASDERVRLVRLQRNMGKGRAVKAGVLASGGSLVLLCDADLSTPIDDLAVLHAAMLPGLSGAIGSRALAGSRIDVSQNPLRVALGRLGNRFIRVVAVPGISDTQCGFKLFDGPMARALFGIADVNGWAFDVEILHLCHRFGWRVVEVPVRWAHAGGSRLRPQAYLQVLCDVVRIRRRHRRSPQPVLVDTGGAIGAAAQFRPAVSIPHPSDQRNLEVQ